jgi:hypothetical protein
VCLARTHPDGWTDFVHIRYVGIYVIRQCLMSMNIEAAVTRLLQKGPRNKTSVFSTVALSILIAFYSFMETVFLNKTVQVASSGM